MRRGPALVGEISLLTTRILVKKNSAFHFKYFAPEQYSIICWLLFGKCAWQSMILTS